MSEETIVEFAGNPRWNWENSCITETATAGADKFKVHVSQEAIDDYFGIRNERMTGSQYIDKFTEIRGQVLDLVKERYPFRCDDLDFVVTTDLLN